MLLFGGTVTVSAVVVDDVLAIIIVALVVVASPYFLSLTRRSTWKARALYHCPTLLVADDPLAVVDIPVIAKQPITITTMTKAQKQQ